MAIILDGKALANKKIKLQKERVAEISKLGRSPGLGIVLVGDNASSITYVKKKVEACDDIGILCIKQHMSATATQSQVASVIERFNYDDNIDGILVQIPLPTHINAREIIATIDPKKDVDGLGVVSSGMLFQCIQGGILPCTPKGVVELLDSYDISIKGKSVVVVGDSNIVGRPMAALMLNRLATVTICHKETIELERHTRQADILIVAVGKKHLITPRHVKPNAVVVDIGFNNENGKLYGDVDYNGVTPMVSAITPVPGGVGPMTVSTLIDNLIDLADKRCNRQ